MPKQTPADVVLYVVGPDPGPTVQQLRALGYRAVDPTTLPDNQRAAVLTNCDGIAAADDFAELTATVSCLQMMRLGQALGKPALPVTVWAQATGPAVTWFAELFEGAL